MSYVEKRNGKKTGRHMAQIKNHPTLGNIHVGFPTKLIGSDLQAA
jgi:hypothetical protein